MQLRAGLLLLTCLLAACGGADAKRPVILATVPPADTILDNVVDEFLVLYDEPVQILSPSSARGIDDRGVMVMIPSQDTDDPRLLRIRPPAGDFLRAGSFSLVLEAGLEANFDNQYRLDPAVFDFELGDGSDLFVGSRGRGAVVQMDRNTFTEIAAVPTPAGRAPLGLRGTQVGLNVRLWVQLASGGGDGHAVAWYEPGDAAMSVIPLTSGGGDLVTTRNTIALGVQGPHIYVAFRDETLGRVRLSEIDVRTATETRTLLLSPAAGPGTWPTGIQTSASGNQVYVTCATDGDDRFCAVRTPEFEERNLGSDPGVDGVVLNRGGGALSVWDDLTYVANLPQPTAYVTVVETATGFVPTIGSSDAPGHPEDIFLTPEGAWLLTALGDFEDDEGIVVRSRVGFYDQRRQVVVSTTSGLNPPATTVRQFTQYRTEARFLTLFDNDAAATWRWTFGGIEQEDFDADLEDLQAADLSQVAPDPVCATFVSGFYPP